MPDEDEGDRAGVSPKCFLKRGVSVVGGRESVLVLGLYDGPPSLLSLHTWILPLGAGGLLISY